MVFQMLFKFLIPQLNNHLNDGIPLPPLEPFFSFKKSELNLLDRYIRIDINPEPCKEVLEERIQKMMYRVREAIADMKDSR